MVSIKSAARASIVVSTMIAAVLAEPGERMLRENPLGALDNQDLADLLDMDLDQVFLMPKTMLEDGGGLPGNDNNKKDHRHNNNNNSKRHHQNRHLQEDEQEGGSPSPFLAETAAPTAAPTAAGAIDRGILFTPSPSLSSLAETTGAPTDATDRGFTSSFFSSSSSSSAAPTAAPTMGSGSRGGLFGTGSPTAAPSSLGRDFDVEEDDVVDVDAEEDDVVDVDVEEDDVGDVTPPREVAAAQKLLGGGSAGVAVGFVTMTFLVVVAGVLS